MIRWIMLNCQFANCYPSSKSKASHRGSVDNMLSLAHVRVMFSTHLTNFYTRKSSYVNANAISIPFIGEKSIWPFQWTSTQVNPAGIDFHCSVYLSQLLQFYVLLVWTASRGDISAVDEHPYSIRLLYDSMCSRLTITMMMNAMMVVDQLKVNTSVRKLAIRGPTTPARHMDDPIIPDTAPYVTMSAS